ncbi:MAG: PEP-CTERM sorting domain-containing protein, partial [Bryobacteraceae bacterium]
GGDDNLIGILNNSGATITSITLTSSTDDIFAFDGDGICGDVNGAQTTTVPGYTFVGGGNPCVNSTDPSGYGGPYTLAAATNVSDMTGTITFGNGGLGNGGSSFFSLEGPVDLNLQVGPGTPEPATFSLMGIAMCGLLLVRRIRKV